MLFSEYYHLKYNENKAFNYAELAYEKLEDKSTIHQKTLGFLYAEAGAFYYRDKKLEVALEMIHAGLKILPDDRRLNSQLNIVLTKGDMDDEYYEDDE